MSRLAIQLNNREVNKAYLAKLRKRFENIQFNEKGVAIPIRSGILFAMTQS